MDGLANIESIAMGQNKNDAVATALNRFVNWFIISLVICNSVLDTTGNNRGFIRV